MTAVTVHATADRSEEQPAGEIVILAPLWLEARAARSGAPWADVRQSGMGPRRAARAARSLLAGGDRPILIAGFCGALHPELEPGDIVLASELRGPAGAIPCDDPTILAGALRRGGLRVQIAPIASSRRLVLGEQRRVLHRTGAVAVDMESAWLAAAARSRPLVTLRVVLDTSRRELHRPLRTISGAASAYRALRSACSLAEEWAGALGPRELLLAAPGAQGRQDSVPGLAEGCELMLVIGPADSPGSRRLVELAERAGCRAIVAGDAAEIPPAALRGVRRIGLMVPASAPEAPLQAMIRALGGLGEVAVSRPGVATETMRPKLAPEFTPGRQ